MTHIIMPLAMSRRCALSSNIVSSRVSCRSSITRGARPSHGDTWGYTTFARLAKSAFRLCCLWLLASLFGLSLGAPVLHAQTLFYVDSPSVDLNVRTGPGSEHEAIAKLPHGAPVFVHDRQRLWLKITAPELGIEGWVSQRYLADQPPGKSPRRGAQGGGPERQRFDRLKRKGIIRVQLDKARDRLRIRMSDLIWMRFDRRQQRNFLERASRLYRAGTVEVYNNRGIARTRMITSGPDAPLFESLHSRR